MVPASWLILALIHAIPAAVLVRPGLLQTLYGVADGGDLAILLVHRGALFLAIAILCAYAAWEPDARRAASLAVGISVIGFLVIYAAAGAPAGSLRMIAIADLIALVPLAITGYSAWRAAAS
jgi:hypothetical protein